MKLLVGIMFAVGLLAPILYAVDTLSRMRHTRVYPLIRLQEADGRAVPLEVNGAGRHRPLAAGIAKPAEDAHSTARRIT